MSVYHSELLLNIIKRNLYMNYRDYDLLWFIGDIHTYSYKSISNGVGYNRWLGIVRHYVKFAESVRYFASMVLAILIGYNLKTVCY